MGKTLGGYRIIRCLGEGGMAVVYEAEQRSLRRRIALKVLPLDLARDTQFVARFRQEALAVAALKHPGIVQIYDVGEDGGYHFFSMELVDGLSLEDYLRRHGRMDVPTSLLMIRQAATALEHARQAGIVHRDIKPSNILLDRQGQAKIADLGLAKAAMDVGVRTRTRALLGTPHYMAPEQSDRATEVDTRADIYSLGVTWYHVLAGQPPFDGQTPIEIIMQHHETPLPSLSAVCPDVPAGVERVVRKMVAKRPADRYQTPAEVVAAVIACSREMPSLARAPKAGAFVPGPPTAGRRDRRVASRSRTKKTVVAVPIIVALLLAGVAIGLWLQARGSTGEPAASRPENMVEVPAGKLYKGSWDHEETVALLDSYNMKLISPPDDPEVVDLPAFMVDRCEVTNAEYREFLEYVRSNADRSFCHSDAPADKDYTPDLWDDPIYNRDDQPVVGVDWYKAYAYARWAGKRLPTGDEWERAARGSTKRLYPWGDEFDAARSVCAEASASAPESVRSHPEGRTPAGLFHMAGNVMEWTTDGVAAGGQRNKSLRGGSWRSQCGVYGLTHTRSLSAPAAHGNREIGFRCVADAEGSQDRLTDA